MNAALIAAMDYYLQQSKKEAKNDIKRKRNRDIRYFTEKYINGIEKNEFPIEFINKVSEIDIKDAYGANSYMMERYNKIKDKLINGGKK